MLTNPRDARLEVSQDHQTNPGQRSLKFIGNVTIRIRNHIRSIEWWHFQWTWVTFDLDLLVFKVAVFLKSNISKTVRLGPKLLNNTNRKSYIPSQSNGTTYNDLEWPLTRISRSWHFSTLNISETTRDRDIVTTERYSTSKTPWPWKPG